jgi:hypothetical protein
MSFGFIITRCVREESHRPIWQECYACIRKLYCEEIIIIDDNSNESLIDIIELVNTRVIKSEFPAAGELLSYYYFHKFKPFDKAIIMHDGMFVKKSINSDIESTTSIKFLWYFETHEWDNAALESVYIKLLSDPIGLKTLYDQTTKWFGCFGVCSIITYEYVQHLHTTHNIFNLLKFITSRTDRMAIERILALLAFYDDKVTLYNCSIFGEIANYPNSFLITYPDYKNYQSPDCKIVKVWSRR